MTHQEWDTIVFKKQQNADKRTKNHYEVSKDHKLYNESENLSHDNVGLSLGKQIQQARISLGYKTQKDLAVLINTKPDIIASYENGKAIPDTHVLQKLRKVLNSQLKVRKT